MRILYVTHKDISSAKTLAGQIVAEKLAGCVNIIPAMTSVYLWEGHLKESAEVVMLVKTTKKKAAAAQKFIEQHHPYDVPCILALKVKDGNEAYRRWIAAQVGEEPEKDE